MDALNGNRITTSWTLNILDNSLYDNDGRKVGINCSTTTGILEKLLWEIWEVNVVNSY